MTAPRPRRGRNGTVVVPAVLALAVTLVACGGASDGSAPDAGDAAGTRPAGSGEEFGPAGEAPGSVPPPEGAVDARLVSLDELVVEVEAALADAADRSGVPADEIAVATALAVTWADGSLGCPQPDMAYTMALVPGYLLTLEIAGERVEYHGGAGVDPFPCDWPED